MRRGWVVLLCLLLAACDFTVPVAREPAGGLDGTAFGAWTRPAGGGGRQRLVVLPLDEHHYLVAFHGGDGDTLYARAWPVRAAGLSLVQIEWLGTDAGERPPNPRVYQLARTRVTRDGLEVALVDPAVVGNDMQSPQALAQALGEHEDPFRRAMRFERSRQASLARPVTPNQKCPLFCKAEISARERARGAHVDVGEAWKRLRQGWSGEGL